MTDYGMLLEEHFSDEASLRLKVETVFGRHGFGQRRGKVAPEADPQEEWWAAAEELAEGISARECAVIFTLGLKYFLEDTYPLS